MAMNPMQKKARTSFLLGMLLTLVITGLVIGALILQLSKMKQEQNSIKYQEVYVLTEDVTSGDNLLNKGKYEQVPLSNAPNNSITRNIESSFLTEEAVAKIGLRKGQVLTTDMINLDKKTSTSDVRLQEYNMIILPTQLEKGTSVDVRLRLPSGEDYIVLSQKHVEQTNGDTIWIKVSEDEILTMSNAIVEAYIMEGSLLYATTYVDAGMQDASIPTYVVKQEVINLMNSNSNITAEARDAIRARYTDDVRAQRNNINNAINGYGEDSLSNIQEKTAQEIEKRQTARQQYVESLGIQ